MKKTLIAAAAMALLASAATAEAAKTSKTTPAPEAATAAQTTTAAPQHPHQINLEAIKRSTNARIAATKESLALTPAQEKKWPAAAAAILRYNTARIDNMIASRNRQPPSDQMALLEDRVASLTSMGDSMRELATALKPLYVMLDAEQRLKLMTLAGMPKPRTATAAPQPAPTTATPPTTPAPASRK